MNQQRQENSFSAEADPVPGRFKGGGLEARCTYLDLHDPVLFLRNTVAD